MQACVLTIIHEDGNATSALYQTASEAFVALRNYIVRQCPALERLDWDTAVGEYFFSSPEQYAITKVTMPEWLCNNDDANQKTREQLFESVSGYHAKIVSASVVTDQPTVRVVIDVPFVSQETTHSYYKDINQLIGGNTVLTLEESA